MKKVVLITGASSGIGKEAAKYFAAQNWNVIASMRNPEQETELNRISNIQGTLDLKIFHISVMLLGKFTAYLPQKSKEKCFLWSRNSRKPY